MFCALLIPDFRLQAVLRCRPESWRVPVAVTDLGAVVECTPAAARAGVARGMSPAQALARNPNLRLAARAPAAERTMAETLLGMAGGASAYVEQTAENICTLDLQGLRMPDLEVWGTALAGRLAGVRLRAFAGIAEIPDLALLAALEIKANLLAFLQSQTGALDGGDMHEHILAAIIGLNETEAFGGVEPLDRTN